jgi:hypothetical protein
VPQAQLDVHLDTVPDTAARAFCPGRRVVLRFLEWWRVKDVRTFLGNKSKAETMVLRRVLPGSALLIFPPGLHADLFKPDMLLRDYVQPILDAIPKAAPIGSRPVVLISGVHSMGPNQPKMYAKSKQSPRAILTFNRALRAFADSLGLSYLDTYDLTRGLYTSDGVHYGAEANLLKAQLLLNFLDLRWREAAAAAAAAAAPTRRRQ